MPSAYEVFFAPQNRAVTNKLINYSAAMVIVPIGTFYASYYLYFKLDPAGLAWSGILAVIATNIVIISYVIMAWNEDAEDTAERKRIKQSNETGSILDKGKPKTS